MEENTENTEGQRGEWFLSADQSEILGVCKSNGIYVCKGRRPKRSHFLLAIRFSFC